jgi:hypothetical protein
MDGIKDWIFPTTRIADAVRYRPASLAAFYGIGCNPWEEGEKSLEWLCMRYGIPLHRLMRELGELPVPGPQSPWDELPACFLIDFLTSQHREFIHADLPALRALLDADRGRISGTRLFGLMGQTLHRFGIVLRKHIQEEEESNFPAILRNEYALRHGCVGSKEPVAESLLASDRLLEGEERVSFALDQWLRTAEQSGQLDSGPVHLDIAVGAMRDLARKIRSHERIERERLYPIAARIETELDAIAVGG